MCRGRASNKTPSEWILVTHGTDTMVETARYLGTRHKEVLPTKSVCITGAMRAERFVDTDAHFNFGVCLGALSVASPGVYLCMNGLVYSWDAVQRDMETGLFVAVTP